MTGTGTTLPPPAPTHYVPSGVSMSAARRAHILLALCRRGCVLASARSATVVRTVVNRLWRPRRSVRVWVDVVVVTRHHTCGDAAAGDTTMKKHSKQLEKRIEEQRQQRLPGSTAHDCRRRSSKCKNGILKNESSPELSRPASRKSRQYFLEPIRRWNSFHNSRERKSAAVASATATASTGSTTPASSSSSSVSNLPYLQTLVNLQRESKSACARLAQSVLPKMPRGADSAPVLGAVSTAESAVAQPSSFQPTAAGSPAKKQNSSPNLLLVYDRRQQNSGAGGVAGCGSGGNSLTNSPRRSARRPKTPPPHPQPLQQQQQNVAAVNSVSSDGSSKIPFAIMVGDTPIVCKDAAVPRIKAIRADSVTEKSSSSYLAVDLSPHRRYSFWSVI